MNPYHREQIEAYAMVHRHLASNPFTRQELQAEVADYLAFRTPLMYLHNSPGLLRVKQKAGLIK